MASLDEMLLEAAGRTKAKEGKQKHLTPIKRRELYSSSDEGSDYNSDNEYYDSFGGGTGQKSSGSKMPLKKCFESADKDEEEQEGDRGIEDGSDSSISYGSDLYRNDEDREQLAKMSELEREMILHERSEARDHYLMRKRAETPKFGSRNQRGSRIQGPPSSRVRSSFRDSSSKTAKKNALSELVARRQKAEDSGSQNRKWDSAIATLTKFSTKASRSISASLSSSGSEDEDDKSRILDQDSDGDDIGVSSRAVSFDDIKGITVRRSKLAKWFMEPFFEEIIVGCFVRVGIGMSRSGQSIYRLCMVKNVDASEPDKQYTFENWITHKYLNCVWGDEASAASWQMTRVSDSPPEEKEYKDWEREVERSGSRLPTLEEVLEKEEAIKRLSGYVYSAAAVKQMLEAKKSAVSKPSNVAVEKNRLMKELVLAESKNEHAEVEKLQERLKELEAYSVHSMSLNAKAVMLSELNRKNRYENFKNASENKTLNLFGETGNDPFCRRWTRSQNYYRTGKPKKADADEKEAVRNTDDTGEDTTAAVQEAAGDAGKLVDTNAPVDPQTELFNLHNFELPISLAPLQKFGGIQGVYQAFMARKQRLESTCGVRVNNNDGQGHLALTVNDYKRRRGLL
eukprot:Gb_11901 [translate_table: standard]